LVLAFLHFDSFVRSQPKAAVQVLDVFQQAAHLRLLYGDRLLVLLQSDDSNLTIPRIGAVSVSWNPREWLRSNRS
jgi:hypothetical protein